MRYQNQTALVTGASSGIGAAFARALAARGSDLVLVARRTERMKELAGEIEATHGVQAHVVGIDLSQERAVEAVSVATERLGVDVDILVNCAGFGTYGRYETINPAKDNALIQVGVMAAVDLTHRYLPGMVDRRAGAVINVSSTAAFQPVPHQAVYGASKAFLQSFSEALWAENRATGVGVVACCPAAADTEYFEVLGNDDEARFGAKRPPRDAVERALRALDRGRPLAVVGLRWKLTALLPRLLPRAIVARVLARRTRPRNG